MLQIGSSLSHLLTAPLDSMHHTSHGFQHHREKYKNVRVLISSGSSSPTASIITTLKGSINGLPSFHQVTINPLQTFCNFRKLLTGLEQNSNNLWYDFSSSNRSQSIMPFTLHDFTTVLQVPKKQSIELFCREQKLQGGGLL
ncbi:hypothetical protein O6H91_12G105400 [Diphasiastrum complanatum]|uniref:Uncharacterized protein n=1 Tax=Diphasiastrum complanatum TaxID=34168 RepID=A0ACC2C6K2_DIPCM|nr:hypothetical protein O6H91_12G105400 [Diphasiastrum complanatum]